jgi:hypothetical protein
MANTVYANKVIEAKAKDLLNTSVNTRNFMTVDSELAQSAGMTKTINVYTYSGDAEEVAVGEGNSSRGSITYASKDYTVKTVQQVFDYYDEDYMKDPSIVDNMLKGANQVMVNKMNSDFFGECAKATLAHSLAGEALSYDGIVDAISKLNVEDESGCFVLIPNEWKADLRKDPDYKAARMGEVIYNGQVGTVAGLPVVPSKALTDAAYVLTKEAVKLFLKKDVEIEQERDGEIRQNTVIERAFYIVALEDATKIVKVTK